jgi:hypothetical protein
MSSIDHEVHPIYTFTFLWLDPILSLSGVVIAFLTPEKLIESWVPTTLPNPATASGLPAVPNPAAVHHSVYNPLIHELGAFFFVMFLLFGIMLRHTRDPFIWKLFVGGVGLVDFAVMGSTAVQYREQGRLNPSTWRVEDWICVLITSYVGIVRFAYVLGLGVGPAKQKKN